MLVFLFYCCTPGRFLSEFMIQESRKIAHNHVLLKIIGYFTESAVIDTENIWIGFGLGFFSNFA